MHIASLGVTQRLVYASHALTGKVQHGNPRCLTYVSANIRIRHFIQTIIKRGGCSSRIYSFLCDYCWCLFGISSVLYMRLGNVPSITTQIPFDDAWCMRQPIYKYTTYFAIQP